MWVARALPQWNIEAYGDRWTEAGLMVSNGPYALKEWTHQAHLTLVKNPFWPDWAKPGMGNIEVIQGPVVSESSTSQAMYEAGEIDYMGDPGQGPPLPDLDRIKADPVLSKEFEILPRLCTYYYGFVNTKPPFDNVLLRKAFAAAIDRQSLIDNVLKGNQLPAHSFVCPGNFGHAADDKTIAPYLLDYTEGLKKAKEWIAQAGYPEGEGLDLVLMHNISEAHARIAQAIQAMWAEAFPKAKITIETQEWAVYLKTLLPTSPDEEKPAIYRMGWCADYPDANNWLNEVFNPKSSQNYAKYDNPKFTELVEKAAVEPDPEVRKKLYDEAEHVFIDEDMGIAPIYYYTRLAETKPYLTNRITMAGGGGDPVWLWKLDWAAKKAAK
jgi:oligopeptide transport system substrate-binding protein